MDADMEDSGWDSSRRFRDHMEYCHHAYKAGVTLAISEAVAWCGFYNQGPPEWLQHAVRGLVMQRRSKAEAKRYTEDMVHFERWAVVLELRVPRGRHMIPWELAYEQASEALKHTAARGQPETIKASYAKVQRYMNNGKRGKYFVIQDRPRSPYPTPV